MTPQTRWAVMPQATPFLASERWAEENGGSRTDIGVLYRAQGPRATGMQAWVACERRTHAPYAACATASRKSLKTIESDSAWNEASTILGDTPTVNQRLPLPSRLSTRTRVVAPVPPLRMRTL